MGVCRFFGAPLRTQRGSGCQTDIPYPLGAPQCCPCGRCGRQDTFQVAGGSTLLRIDEGKAECVKRKIRVAEIVSGLSMSGGVQHVAYGRTSFLNRALFTPMVFALTERGELADDLEQQGIEVITLNAVSSSHPVYYLRNLREAWHLSRLLRSKRIDVVETHEFFSGTLGRLAAVLAGTPVILLMLHNKDLWKRWPLICIDRLLAKCTAAIVTNSNSVSEFVSRFERISPQKFTTIYNGIDPERFDVRVDRVVKRKELCLDGGSPTICCIGRIVVQKGHRYLLESLPRVIKAFPEVQLLIVGGDERIPHETDYEAVCEMVERLHLSSYVRFLGWQRDIPEILQAIDVLVMPSLWEGFGLTIAEAMAARKPVVATAVDGIPEVVVHGETGLLVPSKDPEALAEAIIFILSQPQRAKQMGEAGRARVEAMFDIRKTTRMWERLVLTCLQQKGVC